MSFRSLFDKAVTVKSLANKSAEEIGAQIESVGYHTEDILHEERFIPQVDFSKPETFARFGSAEEYYGESIDRIIGDYPYDGSLRERLKWENESTYIDLHILDNLYPRTTGWITMSAGGYGPLEGSITADGYGMPTNVEYIYLEGGPHPSPHGTSPYNINFTGSNYLEATKNRQSNLKFDLANSGSTVEFWLKKEEFHLDSTKKEVIFDLWNHEDTSSADYGRFRLELSGGGVVPAGSNPVLLTVMSGTLGFESTSIAPSTFVASDIVGGSWNHYAVSVKNTTGGKSVHFDLGSTDAINIGEADLWQGLIGGAGDAALPWTLSAWVWLDSIPTSGEREIINFSNSDISLVLDPAGTDNFELDIAGATRGITRSGTIYAQRWYHLVGTFAGGNDGALTFYVNGEDDNNAHATVDNPTGIAGSDCYIGNRNSLAGAFPGYIDEVAIWNKALSLAEVEEVFNHGVPPNLLGFDSAENLIAWYPLGDNSTVKLDGTNVRSVDNQVSDIVGGYHGFGAGGTLSGSQVVDYSPLNNSVTTKFYVNGELKNVKQISTCPPGSARAVDVLTGSLAQIDSPIVARIGSLICSPAGSSALTGSGKLMAGLDEFRYWKAYRSSKDIGRFWFTQVGGGTNNDPEPFIDTQEKVNTNLGVYYKFNEGITGYASIDSTILDYSGRVTNGLWAGFTSSASPRNTGSAIVSSSAAIKEFEDPIIYALHPEVVTLKTNLQESGSAYDINNNSAIYNSIPAWITEEDEEGQKQLRYLTQIMGSYFDTLHLQMDTLNQFRDISYVSGSEKPLPFSAKMLNSNGFVSPEIFLDADILEVLDDRSEDRIYAKSLNDIKNLIYKNIYNNLIYIYKSKGTEKSFRNLIRCFGIDDELIKLNLYASNTTYEYRENRRNVVVADKIINFNTTGNTAAVIYSSNTASAVDPTASPPSYTISDTAAFITSSALLTGGYATTLETDVFFPLKKEQSDNTYHGTNRLSASLFGLHRVKPRPHDPAWDLTTDAGTADNCNFQVYAVRDEVDSANAYFILTGSAATVIPTLTSSLYEDLYENNSWNLSVAIKPEYYPLTPYISASNDDQDPAPTPGTPGTRTGSLNDQNYIVVFRGIQADSGEILNSFTVTGTISAPHPSFVTSSRRVFVGAHRTNFTGTLLYSTDVGINSCRYWLNYLDDQALRAHAYDTENHGPLYPHRYAFPFNPAPSFFSASYGEILNIDTLMFNWEFSQNTGSDAYGEFPVTDESSGSSLLAAAPGTPGGDDTVLPLSGTETARFGDLGKLLNKQYSAYGYGFSESSLTPVKKEHIVSSKINPLEVVSSVDQVKVLTIQEQQEFAIDSRPVNYFFSFEKSMYRTISEEMVNYFGSLRDFNNIIGAAVNRYRPNYKIMGKLRNRFFEKVANDEIDFDKFYEYYKWFDSSLSFMLGQLVPISADFAENVRTMIESHALERNKHKTPFPFLDQEKTVFEAPAISLVDYQGAVSSPDDDPQGTAFWPSSAPSRRQLGLSTRALTKVWKDTSAPIGAASAGGSAVVAQEARYLWWKNRVERDDSPLSAPFGSEFNVQRAALFAVMTQSVDLDQRRVYKFSVEGNRAFGGVGLPAGKKVNFVFAATHPWGPSNPNDSDALKNVMLANRDDLEQLLNTTDRFYGPNFKQRLGLSFNASVNDDNQADRLRTTGVNIAPFSVYSSSVSTGYVSEIASDFTGGIDFTNLHHDLVFNADIPLQSPFTEKFVGGREYRHVDISDATDTIKTRPEGFRIQFEDVKAPPGSTISNAVAIIPPNSRGLATDGEIPTGNKFRDETAKRPVNIKNILMTTASVGTRLSGALSHAKIGNYQRSYQVVQSNGRTTNDPFFQDQSFDFAQYPETLATRGRFALAPQAGKSLHFDGDTDYVRSVLPLASWESAIGGAGSDAKAVSFSMWLNADTLPSGHWIFKVGGATSTYSMQVNSDELKFIVGSSGTDPYVFSSTISTGSWTHVVATLAAGTGNKPNMYINGTLDNDSVGSATSNNIAIGGPFTIGYTAETFDGYICDFAVWDKELSAAEALTVYNGGSRANLRHLTMDNRDGDLAAAPTVNLLAWWPLGDDPRDSSDGGIFYDQMGFTNVAANNFTDDATSGISVKSPGYGGYGGVSNVANMRGNLDYKLPSRTGANSNSNIFVNRFGSPGGYEVSSRGYMGPAHEELSVYNALPYRNQHVISYGLSGSASADSTVASTIVVLDQIGKNRGLNQRATLHCGQYGSDAAYGLITAKSTRVDLGKGYVATPSWHKTNRNRKRRMELISGSIAGGPAITQLALCTTGSVYDNLWVQHPIPRSMRQYSWITASVTGSELLGLCKPECMSTSSIPLMITASGITGSDGDASEPSSQVFSLDFVGLRSYVIDPVSASSHTLGYPLASSIVSYQNHNLQTEWTTITVPTFNFLMLNRNGPYQYAMWQQTRFNNHPVVRKLRHENKIGVTLGPKPQLLSNRFSAGYTVRPTRPNSFVDYVEQPISSRYLPSLVVAEAAAGDESFDSDGNYKATYGNYFQMFSHEGLNNHLNLSVTQKYLYDNPFVSLLEYFLNNKANLMVDYSERIYPAEEVAYRNIVRNRTNFTITGSWDPKRSVAARANSQGHSITNQAAWFMKESTTFATAQPTLLARTDGTGEGQSLQSRYGISGAFDITASAVYSLRVPLGWESSPGNNKLVYGGVAAWQAGPQAGKDPYVEYDYWVHQLRLKAKDYSIVPEFRISEHIEEIINAGGDPLIDSWRLDLTGAAYPDTDSPQFWETYTNGEFMKLFGVVDDMLFETGFAAQQLSRNKLSLQCHAAIKFLPYPGFYPLQRMRDLATRFSQSYGDYVYVTASADYRTSPISSAYRAIEEPLFAPGIWFNTYKSGLAVGSYIMGISGGYDAITDAEENWARLKDIAVSNSVDSADSQFPEGVINFGSGSLLSCSITASDTAYFPVRIPFEAVYKPQFLSSKAISGSFIYDNGVGSASLSGNSGGTHLINRVSWDGQGDPLYRMMADNTLSSIYEMFIQDPVSFVSKEQDQFTGIPAKEGEKFAMTFHVNRTLGRDGKADRNKFEMYSRNSAFGPPVVLDAGAETAAGGPGDGNIEFTASCSPSTPCYINGTSSVTIVATASFGGFPSLADLLSSVEYIYDTQLESDSYHKKAMGYWFAQKVSESFNLSEVMGQDDSSRWLIQSKFETPMFNFSNVSADAPVAADVSLRPGAINTVTTKGIGHQLGTILAKDEGVECFITTPTFVNSPTYGRITNPKSLSKLVGFQEGVKKKLGVLKNEFRLEEAVVVVPYIQRKRRREFLKFPRARAKLTSYQNLLLAMKKYIFPPKFDFTRFREVKPVLMYVFEYGMDLNQDDLSAIWQNLPPGQRNINCHLCGCTDTKFELKEIEIEERELVNKILAKDEDLYWMVFKVKKRAARNFEKTRRSFISSETQDIPAAVGEYSYNWPYDNFSLVELVKIEESVRWISEEICPECEEDPCEDPEDDAPTPSPAPPVNPTADAPVPTAPKGLGTRVLKRKGRTSAEPRGGADFQETIVLRQGDLDVDTQFTTTTDGRIEASYDPRGTPTEIVDPDAVFAGSGGRSGAIKIKTEDER